MLIHCNFCKSKFAVNAEEVGFEGRLVKCGNCQKEWFQESKAQILEKKLIDLDRNLHTKEIELIEQKNKFSDKIAKLEKGLKNKQEEAMQQKLVEGRIGLFESRIIEKENEIELQSKVEKRISQLEKEIEKSSLDSFIKNVALEKRTNKLQEKINSETLNERLNSLEKDFNKITSKSEINKSISTREERKDYFKSLKNNEPTPFEVDEIKLMTEDENTPVKKEDENIPVKKEDENTPVKKKEETNNIINDEDDSAEQRYRAKSK